MCIIDNTIHMYYTCMYTEMYVYIDRAVVSDNMVASAAEWWCSVSVITGYGMSPH